MSPPPLRPVELVALLCLSSEFSHLNYMAANVSDLRVLGHAFEGLDV